MNKCAVCGRTQEECQVHYCTKYGDYLCSKHKNQFRRNGKIVTQDDKIKHCEFCGVSSEKVKVQWCEKANQYLCIKHRGQFLRLGFCKERTKRDKNIYVTCGDYTKILFEDQEGNIVGFSYIDTEDREKCEQHKWMLSEDKGNTRYVSAIINGRHTSLHRFLFEPLDSFLIVDHINRNGLDNRKNNLRAVSLSENSVNSRTRSATNEKNIYKKGNKYQVQIIRNYKTVFCKSFASIQEAIEARDCFIVSFNTENHRKI